MEKKKQLIIDALNYNDPLGQWGLGLGSMATYSLCRIYYVDYNDPNSPRLTDCVRRGNAEQTKKAYEICKGVIEHGVLKHPQRVNGPHAYTLEKEVATLRKQVAFLRRSNASLRGYLNRIKREANNDRARTE